MRFLTRLALAVLCLGLIHATLSGETLAGNVIEELRDGQLGPGADPTDVFFFQNLQVGIGGPDAVLATLLVDRGLGDTLEIYGDTVGGQLASGPQKVIPLGEGVERTRSRFRDDGDDDDDDDDDDDSRRPGTKQLGPDDRYALAQSTAGTQPSTMGVDVSFFDGSGTLTGSAFLDNIPTFPDPGLNTVDVSLATQNRATVFYVDLPPAANPRVLGQRVDGATGALVGAPFVISTAGLYPAAALLDSGGNRIFVAYVTAPNAIVGNIIDLSGPTPVVGPIVPVSTSVSQFGHYAPVAAADTSSGVFMVAWEDITGQQGDPLNVRARRFDADGNPLDSEFIVNSTLGNTQAQPAIASFRGLETFAVVWAADGTEQEDLDVFLQVFGADGQPLSVTDLPVTTAGDAFQDRPVVRFLEELDGQGRPQGVVSWRDVGHPSGDTANGTGTSYKVFAVNGVVPSEPPIFADGFESGTTTAWGSSQP
ncbi:MAG: hypothetical protein MI919_11660 [Holophagales bacterium]|nr:hypothetical protein [Holophagales bacterium]